MSGTAQLFATRYEFYFFGFILFGAGIGIGLLIGWHT